MFLCLSSFFRPKTRWGPRPDRARSFGIILSSKNRNPNMLVKPFHEIRQKHGPKIMKNPTFANPMKTRTPETMPM